MTIRMRKPGLAAACALVLAASYPAGQSAAQLTINRAEISRGVRSAVAGRLTQVDRIARNIASAERRARSAYVFGECATFASARRSLEVIADGISDQEQNEWLIAILDSEADQLEALAQAALDSLPSSCDPDPVVRSSLARDEDNARHGGNDGDAN